MRYNALIVEQQNEGYTTVVVPRSLITLFTVKLKELLYAYWRGVNRLGSLSPTCPQTLCPFNHLMDHIFPQICFSSSPSQSLQCHIVYHRCSHISRAIQLQKMLSYCLIDVVWCPLVDCAWNHVIIGDITGGFLLSSKGKSSWFIVEVGNDHD